MNSNPLDLQLDHLFEAAQETSPTTRSIKLERGLHISMTVNDTLLTLALRRENSFPSMSEWKIILNHMPFPCNGEPAVSKTGIFSTTFQIHPKLL